MKTGTSGSVSSMISADSQSITATRGDDEQRNHRGEHDLRQVAGEVALQRLDALHRDRRDLRSARAVDGDRLCSQPLLARAPSRSSERTLQAARCARRSSIPHAHAPRSANATTSSPRSSRRAVRRTPVERRARRSAPARRPGAAPPARWRVPARCRSPAAVAPTSCVGAGAGPGRARRGYPRRGGVRRRGGGTRGTTSPGRAARSAGSARRRPSSRRARSGPAATLLTVRL